MEAGFPLLNCLLQFTLRSLCSTSSDSSSSKWVYAVFWKILPRNYPPPKWDHCGTALDRSKGNKRNWMLVWEDGFCDFLECERQGSGYKFGADVFFKLSHEVYSYGEGLLGKVAAERSHKWVFSDSTNEPHPIPTSSWNTALEPQPRAWECQFHSGIQTIAIISVREGIIQLGSFDKIVEDVNLVINIQRKFSYLQSIPGTFATQRSYLPIQHTNVERKQRQTIGMKRAFDQRMDGDEQYIFSIPPLLPTTAVSCRPLLTKLRTGDVVNNYSCSNGIPSNRIKSEDEG
ncbi:Protein RICE SALT SENSITIVE 3 [Linum grandiflorum]